MGGGIIRAVVDYRTNFLAGGSCLISAKGKKEQKFIDDFVTRTQLDTLLLKRAVRNGELEGKALLQLYLDSDGQVCVKLRDWFSTRYMVVTDPTDYNTILSVDFPANNAPAVSLDPSESVYVKIYGTDNVVNYPSPNVAHILFLVDSIEKCMIDLRKTNSAMGHCWPFFSTTGANAAQAAEELTMTLNRMNWEPGMAMAAGDTDVKMVSPNIESANTYKVEMQQAVQKICAISSVPSYLIDIEIFSARATSAEVTGAVRTGLSDPRMIWEEKIKELIKKAMAYDTAYGSGTTYKTDSIVVELPDTSDDAMSQITTTWLPLYQEGAISLRTLVEKCPDLDYDLEQDRIAEEKANEPNPVVTPPVLAPVPPLPDTSPAPVPIAKKSKVTK